MNQMAAGWYHAEGDAPGTVRYWDGQIWVGDPQPSVQQQPPPPRGSQASAPSTGPASIGDPILPPTFGNPQYPATSPPPGQYPPGPPGATYVVAPRYPESSQAVGALLVALIGIFACSGITAPISWKMANDEIKAIDAGRRDPKDRGLAVAAQVISIVVTVLLALLIIGIVLVVIVGVASSA